MLSLKRLKDCEDLIRNQLSSKRKKAETLIMVERMQMMCSYERSAGESENRETLLS